MRRNIYRGDCTKFIEQVLIQDNGKYTKYDLIVILVNLTNQLNKY